MTEKDQPPAANVPERRTRAGARRHEQAVIQAEVRRLARALRPYRVLRRDELERSAGAAKWNDGGFDRALEAAVQTGAVKRLPFGFYGCADAEFGHHTGAADGSAG
jgi:hypothetical protein